MPDIYDGFEDLGAEAKKEVEKLKKSVELVIAKKIGQGKSPLIAATLAGTLVDKAFFKIKNILGDGFDTTLRELQKQLIEFDIKLDKADLKAIAELKSVVLDSITIPSQRFKNDLKAAMLLNITKGVPKTELIAGIKSIYPAMGAQVDTLVNTSLQRFYKSATYTAIGDDFEYFKYSGPLDSVTREYCRNHVNKVYTKDEADKIQSDILEFYNCRHELIPITKSKYESEL